MQLTTEQKLSNGTSSNDFAVAVATLRDSDGKGLGSMIASAFAPAFAAAAASGAPACGPAGAGASSFSATSRCRRVSQARNTSVMPPPNGSDTIWSETRSASGNMPRVRP